MQSLLRLNTATLIVVVVSSSFGLRIVWLGPLCILMFYSAIWVLINLTVWLLFQQFLHFAAVRENTFKLQETKQYTHSSWCIMTLLRWTVCSASSATACEAQRTSFFFIITGRTAAWPNISWIQRIRGCRPCNFFRDSRDTLASVWEWSILVLFFCSDISTLSDAQKLKQVLVLLNCHEIFDRWFTACALCSPRLFDRICFNKCIS